MSAGSGSTNSTCPPSALSRSAISAEIRSRPSRSWLPDSIETRSLRVSSSGAFSRAARDCTCSTGAAWEAVAMTNEARARTASRCLDVIPPAPHVGWAKSPEHSVSAWATAGKAILPTRAEVARLPTLRGGGFRLLLQHEVVVDDVVRCVDLLSVRRGAGRLLLEVDDQRLLHAVHHVGLDVGADRKSTRLNSSH